MKAINVPPEIKDFCFAADGNFSMPLQVAVASLLWSMRHQFRPISVHILDMGISNAQYIDIEGAWRHLLTRIGQEGQVSFVRHKIDNSLFNGFMAWHGSTATYARLLMPQLLSSIKWCLYSDCDVLFIESPCSLDEYCNDDLYAVAGHKNPIDCNAIERIWFESKKLPFDNDLHICCGFLLMDLEFMRKDRFSEKAFAFLNTYKQTPSADQTPINVLCRNSRKLLPSKWGMTNGEICGINIGGALHFIYGAPWKVPANATDIIGSYPGIVRLWKRFAIEVAGVKPSAFNYKLRYIIPLKLRAALVWTFLTLTRLLRLPQGKYECYTGQYVTKETLTKMDAMLF